MRACVRVRMDACVRTCERVRALQALKVCVWAGSMHAWRAGWIWVQAATPLTQPI